MTIVEKLKLLTITDKLEFDPKEVQSQFPECVEAIYNPQGSADLRVKGIDVVLLKAILELEDKLKSFVLKSV